LKGPSKHETRESLLERSSQTHGCPFPIVTSAPAHQSHRTPPWQSLPGQHKHTRVPSPPIYPEVTLATYPPTHPQSYHKERVLHFEDGFVTCPSDVYCNKWPRPRRRTPMVFWCRLLFYFFPGQWPGSFGAWSVKILVILNPTGSVTTSCGFALFIRGEVETPIHDNIRDLVTWECKEHGME
jgi:hypothetical protein